MAGAAVAALALSGAAPAGEREVPYGAPEPVRYDLDVSWAPAGRVLTGVETVVLRNAGTAPLPTVWLRLWPNGSGSADGCADPGVVLTGVVGARLAGRAVACSAAALALPAPLAPGASATVVLRFRAFVPKANDVLGRSAGIDLFGQAVPTLAVRDAQRWHLDPDTAVGDSPFTLSAAWHATIRVPRRLSVASTGRETSNTVAGAVRTVVADTPHARDFAFAVGAMQRRAAVVDGVRVRVFSTPAGATTVEAKATLAVAGRALHTFDDWFGRYGSPELDVVITALPYYGDEYPELVFSEPDRATVTHEVAHQWFYGIVGDDQYREPWLDESFAAWSEEQLNPGTYVCDPADPFDRFPYGLSRGVSYFRQHPDDYTDDDYTDVVYRGGACALTVLAADLGRPRFLALLRQEVAAYRYRVIHTPEFLALIQGADPAVADRWTTLAGLR